MTRPVNENVLNYGRRSPSEQDWSRFFVWLVLGVAAIPVGLIAAIKLHDIWFKSATDSNQLCGKTVAQIVARLGLPDEDLRDTDKALFVAAAGQPIHIVHTYGPSEHFSGDFVYLNLAGWGGDFCRIEIRNGVATQVLHLPDMK